MKERDHTPATPVPAAGKRRKKEHTTLGNDYPLSFPFLPAVGTFSSAEPMQFTRDGWEQVSR